MNSIEYGKTLLEAIEAIQKARMLIGKLCDSGNQNVDNNVAKVFNWLVQADNILAQPQYKDSARQLSLLG